MVVGEVPEGADLLIVGAGPGGYTAALHAARLGRRVVLVDRLGVAGIGGACLRVGCIPSKALIEVSDAAHRAKGFKMAGLDVGDIRFDLARFQEWKDDIVETLAAAVSRQLRDAGVEVVAGELRFTRPGSCVVQTTDQHPPRHFEYVDVILAPGSRPAQLPGIERDGEKVLDSTDVLALRRVPDTVTVVGGGYIGLELGTALAKIGSRVTMVEAADQLLPGVDAALLRPVVQRLDQLGVELLIRHQVKDFDGRSVSLSGPSGPRRLDAEKVVIAVGRQPNTDSLGLDRIGIALDGRGRVPTGPDRIAAAHVAAIGDVTAGPALAHKAMAEAEVAAEALSGGRAIFDPVVIPTVVFSDPEIAIAGFSPAEAREAGMDVVVSKMPLSASGRAATMDAVRGFTQLVIEQSTDAIVGVQIVGPHASELIAEGVLAIEMAASPVDLAASIHPHPTLSEMVSDVAERAVRSIASAPPPTRRAPGPTR